MVGTVTISLEEYETLKGLEGKRVYMGDFSQEEVDEAVRRLKEPDVLVEEYILRGAYAKCQKDIRYVTISDLREEARKELQGIIDSAKVNMARMNAELLVAREKVAKLLARNLWERIIRKGEKE